MGRRMAKKRKLQSEGTTREAPRPPKIERTLYRCIAENSVYVKTFEYGCRFGPGQIVDLDEEIGNGSKLRDHVRLTCWKPIRAGG